MSEVRIVNVSNVITKKEVLTAKYKYSNGASIKSIAYELNRTTNTVRRILQGFYDDAPKKIIEHNKDNWDELFYFEWTHAVNRIRKFMGKNPL